MTTHKRRRAAKGKWMDLIDPAILRAYIERRRLTQSKLGEYAGCSRQFIYQLLSGERVSCTPKLAEAIEDVLDVPRGAIFTPKKSNEFEQKARTRPNGGVSPGKLSVA